MMTPLVLGLGTNVGNRLLALRSAVEWLARPDSGFELHAISPIYESEAMLPENVPEGERDSWVQPYLNLAVSGRTELAPLEVLRKVKAIEQELGRRRRARWAPREIDIDLLAWGREEIRLPELSVPHQGLASRPFSLLPLVDLWPEWRFPSGSLAGKTAREAAAPWLANEAIVPYGTRRSVLTLAEVVAIVNVTPDSFSDGGLALAGAGPLALAETRVREGATVLDLGAESTRPGALPLSPQAEWERLRPFLEGWRDSPVLSAPEVRLSVDTYHAETARRALDFGVHWINDVTGGEDPAMREVMASASGPVVIMHSLGVPVDPARTLPPGEDPLEAVRTWAERRLEELRASGVDRARVILDPGIGFGKTAEQNLTLLRRLPELHSLGLPLYLGHSRKSFFKRWLSVPPAERDLETATVSVLAARQGVRYLRVHDAGFSVRALRAWALLEGCVSFRSAGNSGATP